MPWWLLLLLLIVVWSLESVASVAAKSVAAKRRDAPGGTGSGTSLMPGLVMPLLFLGIALVVDHFVNPWGTRVVGTLNAAIGVGFVMYIGWAAWYLKSSSKSKFTRSG
jgi:hypothetical protein